MHDSKLIQLLCTFSPKEFKEFEKFVNSPFFRKRMIVVNLFNELKRFYPEFCDDDLTLEKIYQKLYNKSDFNGGVMRKIISELCSMAEDYLAYINFRKSPVNMKLKLLAELNTRSINKHFEKLYDSISEEITEKTEKDNIYYESFLDKYLLYSEKVNFQININKQDEIMPALTSAGESIIYYCLISTLGIAQDMLVNANAYNSDYTDNPVFIFLESLNYEKLIDGLEKTSPEVMPILKLYFCMFLAYKNWDDDEQFQRCKLKYEQYKEHFSIEQKHSILYFIENSCVMRINRGKSEYVKELFEIYKMMLNEKSFINERDNLHITLFRNIIMTSLRLKEYEWTENFIEGYINKVDEQFRENIYNYSIARLNFEKGRYERSLENLAVVKYDHFIFRTDLKNLLLKIYYELNLYEESLHTADAFLHFLKNNKKVTDFNREASKNFLKYYKSIFKIKLKMTDKIDLAELREEIVNCDKVTNKDWLLEKADEVGMGTASFKAG